MMSNFGDVLCTCALVVVISLGYSQGQVIGNYLKTCDRDSSEVNECLKTAIQEALVKVIPTGIPEIGLPVLDPFHDEDLKVEYKANQVIAKIAMEDVITNGMSKSKVKKVRSKLDDDKFHLEVDMYTPLVIVTGKYKGEGHYNTLNVNANGDFNCTMKKLKYTWKLDGVPEEKDGKTHVRINSFYMRPDLQDLSVHATNIFPDNPILNEQANRIANQNWRLIYRELLPIAQNNWNKIGVRIANIIFLQIPYNELFPILA